MNLQTVASSRPDPVLGVNASANTPDPSSAASSDTFARILDRRVNDTQGASSPSTSPNTPTTAKTETNPANTAPSAPRGKNGDAPDTPPPSPGNVKKDAAEPATTDESVAKKADKPQETGTAAEVAVSPDAAAALAAATLPTATVTTPQVSAESNSTPRPTNPADSAQTAALAKAPLPPANALPTDANADGSTAAAQTPASDFPNPTPQAQVAAAATTAAPVLAANDSAATATSSILVANGPATTTPAAAESAAVPGSPRAILQTVLEKLNASNQSGQQNASPQDKEDAQTLLADTAAPPQEAVSGKHGHSVSSLESAIFQKNTAPDSGKNVSPDIKLREQDAADARLSLAQANVEPVPSSSGSATRTDGFVAHPSVSTHASATPPTVLTVHTPPADAERWASETTQRLVWVAGRGETKAELQLTPPSLGKLEVTLQLNNDQLTAHFVAASQAARDALEHALPQLREQLAQSGLSLGQTSVSTGGGDSNPQSQEDPAPGRTLTGTASRAGANPAPLPLQSTRAGSSLIDHYA